jgi:EpsI family protein
VISRCCLLTVLLFGAIAARTDIGASGAVTTAESLSRFPVAIGSWTGLDSPLDPDVVTTAAVHDYLNRSYRASAGELGLYIGYYQSQRQGEALHSPLFCLPGSGWQPTTTRTLALGAAGTVSRTVNELVVTRGADQLLVLYWYQNHRRVTASEYARKLFQIKDAFSSGRRTDVALVRIVAPIGIGDPAGEAHALALARPFAERVLPEVQARLFRE